MSIVWCMGGENICARCVRIIGKCVQMCVSAGLCLCVGVRVGLNVYVCVCLCMNVCWAGVV